jgi:GNAT superfamily N-acetyltransferase
MSTTESSSTLLQTTPAGLLIRPFRADDRDYEAIVAIGNAVFPEYPDTVEEWKFEDSTRPDHVVLERWVAEIDGRPVGWAGFQHMVWMFHPRRFRVSCLVHPAEQGHGIGRALYATILERVEPYEPLSLRSRSREDMVRGMRFLHDHGYVEDMRDWESRLDVPSFDPAPYAGHEAEVIARGVTIYTLRELIASDPDHRQHLYELDVDLAQDVPHPEPPTPISRKLFDQWVFENPNLLADAYFIAVVNGRYAGSSSLWKSQANAGELYTGLTGIRREFRRMGIALALKLRAIAYAQAQGITTIKTWNESNNRPMLSINEMLGFVKQPAWVNFVIHLRQEGPTE